MVDRESRIPVVRQCQLLELCRSGAYYEPTAAAEADLQTARLIDEAHLQYCWYGSRSIVDWLRKRGVHVNRKRVQRLMRESGIHSTAPQPRGKKAGKEHKIYPYLLRGLSIRRPNSRARPLPGPCRTPGSESAWTAAVAGSITS
jgi:putative transposase